MSKNCVLGVLNFWLFKEIQLDIGFIEERRTTWGNKEVPQTFFYYSPYSRKYAI